MIAVLAIFAAAASPAGDATAKPADPLQKVRCVREQVTGSIALVRKVCHTIAEWNAINRDGNSEARRIIQPGTMNELNQ